MNFHRGHIEYIANSRPEFLAADLSKNYFQNIFKRQITARASVSTLEIRLDRLRETRNE